MNVGQHTQTNLALYQENTFSTVVHSSSTITNSSASSTQQNSLEFEDFNQLLKMIQGTQDIAIEVFTRKDTNTPWKLADKSRNIIRDTIPIEFCKNRYWLRIYGQVINKSWSMSFIQKDLMDKQLVKVRILSNDECKNSTWSFEEKAYTNEFNSKGFTPKS